ncbi:MAG TPA: glycosyltransferase [Candidatus Limnocylindrales bacterium]|nr:glycosyltransferase [Candidatus Limnocylindrales bacterium]
MLPIRRTAIDPDDAGLPAYLEAIARLMPVIVVDGSPPEVFAHHAAVWPHSVVHVPVDEDRRGDLNGKVAGVVTGLRRVRTPKAVIADDDVRYEPFALRRLAALLDDADVVRPQNVFEPAPWHAILDTARTLIARATGGDWPGTLGIRMDVYRRAGGYDGAVLFENLELVRTLRAAGGRERVAYDLFIARRPPSAKHYLSQRVRQAYDEFARPERLAVQLAIAPVLGLAAYRFGPRALAAFALAAIVLAETGRRRGGGARVFPALASACAPVWVLERAATSWAALALRLARGGVRYSHGRLRVAAHPERVLRERLAHDADLRQAGGAR